MAGAKGSKTELSELESDITTILEYYNKYASKKVLFIKKEGIGKSDFTKMLQSDLKNKLTSTDSKKAVKDLIHQLDQNEDGVIDLKEYWGLIGAIVVPNARNRP